MRRAAWGAGLAALGTRRLLRRLCLPRLAGGDGGVQRRRPDVPGGVVPAAAGLAGGAAGRVSRPWRARRCTCDDLFSFLRIQPGIALARRPRCPSRPGWAAGSCSRTWASAIPAAERWAVRHLSFTLRAGEVLALVGENGAGKTTHRQAADPAVRPRRGPHPARWARPARLRRWTRCAAAIGVIFQDFVRYDLTAADNIAVGRIEARDDRARIEPAAAQGRGRRGDRAAAARLRPDGRAPVPRRRRAVRRRVAEGGDRAGLHARCARC